MTTHTDRTARDDQVAALLATGATYAQITQQLEVSTHTIARVLRERRIPRPPGRMMKRRPDAIRAAEAEALRMLRAGATTREIRDATRTGLNRIAALRRAHGLPVPGPRPQPDRLTIEQTFDLYAKPTTDGDHLVWTGPVSGRGLDLLAEGLRLNARAVGFRRHHGRDPHGYLRRTCDLPDCVHGAHHTDRTIRAQRSSREQP